MTRATLVVVALLVTPTLAHAHGRSVSYSTWTLEPSGAHVALRLAALDVTLVGLDPFADLDALARWASERLVVLRGGRPCPTSGAAAHTASDGFVVVDWTMRCDGPPEAIASRILTDVAPSHLHFARVTTPGGAVAERVLTTEEPEWTVAAAAPAGSIGSSFLDYVRLGIDHIRTGYDHLAFVLALLLLSGSLAEVATIVTAFTVAHSVTLALAVLGLVHPATTAVEALIGFSIALVALENAWLLGGRDRVTPWIVGAALVAMALGHPGALDPITWLGLALFSCCHLGLLARSQKPAPLRTMVAFGFGLIHGFGFAGVLANLDLPRDRLVPALLGFNVGVELGQLTVVTAGWIVLQSLGRAEEPARRRTAELGSAAICGLGLFWFVTRAFG